VQVEVRAVHNPNHADEGRPAAPPSVQPACMRRSDVRRIGTVGRHVRRCSSTRTIRADGSFGTTQTRGHLDAAGTTPAALMPALTQNSHPRPPLDWRDQTSVRFTPSHRSIRKEFPWLGAVTKKVR
jgi:hypothetical protein